MQVLFVRVRAAVVDAEEEPQTLRECSGPLATQNGSRQAKPSSGVQIRKTEHRTKTCRSGFPSFALSRRAFPDGTLCHLRALSSPPS